jgi:hypothetical protein
MMEMYFTTIPPKGVLIAQEFSGYNIIGSQSVYRHSIMGSDISSIFEFSHVKR